MDASHNSRSRGETCGGSIIQLEKQEFNERWTQHITQEAGVQRAVDGVASMIDLPPPELHAPLPHLLRGDSRKKQRGAGARGVHPHADAQL